MNPNATFASLEDKALEAAHDLNIAAQNGVRALDSNAQRLREQARHAGDVVRDRAAAAQRRTARYVADEPMKSILAAAAIGALVTGLAMFFSSRRGH